MENNKESKVMEAKVSKLDQFSFEEVITDLRYCYIATQDITRDLFKRTHGGQIGKPETLDNLKKYRQRGDKIAAGIEVLTERFNYPISKQYILEKLCEELEAMKKEMSKIFEDKTPRETVERLDEMIAYITEARERIN